MSDMNSEINTERMNFSSFDRSFLLLDLNFTNVTFQSSNNTQGLLIAKWTTLSVFTLLTLIFGFVGNVTLLLLFIKDRTLRTPFNIYLINLLIADLSCVIVQYPMDFISSLYPSVWFMGDIACTVYLYANFVLEGTVYNAHLLIAINRIWAAVHPTSYRSIHSVRMAFLLCLGMWVYVHLTMVPGWLQDAMYYRLPTETSGCFLDIRIQWLWNVLTEFIVFNIPHCVMVMTFPIIHIARKRQRKKLHRPNAVKPANGQKHDTSLQLRSSTNKETQTLTDALSAHSVLNPNVIPMVQRKKLKQKSHGYLVLAMLTISATICYTPSEVYYLMTTFMEFDAPIFLQVATILFSCQSMLDPILFMAGLESLRTSLARTLFLSRSHAHNA